MHLTLSMFLTIASLSSPPDHLSVQGHLTNGGGAVVDGKYNLKLSLYTDKSGGESFWTYTAVDAPVVDGIFTTTIGAITPDLLADKSEVYVGISVDSEKELPRSSLSSVAFSLVSSRSYDVHCSGCITPEHTSFLAGCAAGQTIVYDGKGWGCGKAGETYTAGNGLVLSKTNEFSVQAGAIDAKHIATGAITLAHLDGSGCANNTVLKFNGKSWQCNAESDPGFAASPAAQITTLDTKNWSMAYGWGNHAKAGYLKKETDPAYNASPAAQITTLDTKNWSMAYGWGNHAKANYLKKETDPAYNASPAAKITTLDTKSWSMAYGWGDHSKAGYLKVPGGMSFRAGRASQKGNNSGQMDIGISYGVKFSGTPYVVATPTINGVSGDEVPKLQILGIGTTGTTARLRRTNGAYHPSTTYYVDWIAVGQIP